MHKSPLEGRSATGPGWLAGLQQLWDLKGNLKAAIMLHISGPVLLPAGTAALLL